MDRLERNGTLIAITAFLAVALFGILARPLLPVDETRYLTVAWEMREGGHWLVPRLNGEIYPHKPPLLFWLINLVWWVTGVSESHRAADRAGVRRRRHRRDCRAGAPALARGPGRRRTGGAGAGRLCRLRALRRADDVRRHADAGDDPRDAGRWSRRSVRAPGSSSGRRWRSAPSRRGR